MIVWAKMRSGEPLLEIHVGRFIFQSQRVNKNFSLRHCHRIDNCTLLAHLLAASNLSGQCEISGQVNGPPVKMQIIPLWTLMRGLHHSRILLNRNRIDTGRDRDWDGTPLGRMQECVTKDPQIVVFSSQREFSCHTTLFLFRGTMTALFDRDGGIIEKCRCQWLISHSQNHDLAILLSCLQAGLSDVVVVVTAASQPARRWSTHHILWVSGAAKALCLGCWWARAL